MPRPVPLQRHRRRAEARMPERVGVYPGFDASSATPFKEITRGRLRDFSGSERVIAGLLSATSEAALDVPLGTTVEPTDAVNVSGVHYQITFVGAASYDAALTVLVARIADPNYVGPGLPPEGEPAPEPASPQPGDTVGTHGGYADYVSSDGLRYGHDKPADFAPPTFIDHGPMPNDGADYPAGFYEADGTYVAYPDARPGAVMPQP